MSAAKRDRLKRVVGPKWAMRELLDIRKVCTHQVTRAELNQVEFGNVLRRLRQDADLSLREVARKLGRSAPFLSDCELGRRKLKLTDQIQFVEICRSNGRLTDTTEDARGGSER